MTFCFLMRELARNFVVEGNILKIKTERMFHFLVFFKVPNTKLASISWYGPTSEQKLGDISCFPGWTNIGNKHPPIKKQQMTICSLFGLRVIDDVMKN